mgnify:CR=1 FL=1
MLNRFQQGGWRRQRQRATSSSSSPRSHLISVLSKKNGVALSDNPISPTVPMESVRSYSANGEGPFRPARSTGLIEASPRTEQPLRAGWFQINWTYRSISANGATPSVLSIKGTIGPSAPCVDGDWSVRTNIFSRAGRLALEIAQRVFSSPSQPHFWAASPENARIALLQGRHGMQHRSGETVHRGERACLE